MRNIKVPVLIAVEGADGVGKHTLVTNLTAKLINDECLKVKSIPFPRYATPLGTLIRKALKGEHRFSDDDYTNNAILQSLFIKDMIGFVDTDLSDFTTMNEYDVIILDRWKYSTLAYGLASGLPAKYLLYLIRNVPNVDVIIVINSDENFRETAGDSFEKDTEFQKRVRAIYHNFLTIDTDCAKYELFFNAHKGEPEKDLEITYKFVLDKIKTINKEG